MTAMLARPLLDFGDVSILVSTDDPRDGRLMFELEGDHAAEGVSWQEAFNHVAGHLQRLALEHGQELVVNPTDAALDVIEEGLGGLLNAKTGRVLEFCAILKAELIEDEVAALSARRKGTLV